MKTTAVKALAAEDAFWENIISQHDVSKDYINMDAGRWGIMANPALEEFIRRTRHITQNSSYYARNLNISPELGGQYREENQIIPKVIAGSLGADEDEVALTRNATEALQHLISGYNKINPGDTVIYSDLDYGSICREMDYLAKNNGGNVVTFNISEPATYENIIDAYESVLTPQDERMHAGITSFRIKGATSRAVNDTLCNTLLSKYNINTNPISGINMGSVVRIVPGLYNNMADMDKFSAALKDILG